MPKSRLRIVLSGLACGAMVAVSLAQPAQAATTAPSNQCSFDLSTGITTCYDSYQALITDISGGAVTTITSPSQITDDVVATIAGSGAAPRSAAARPAATASTFILSIISAPANYGDPTFTFTQNFPCDTDSGVEANVRNMPAGWNDRLSSFRSFSDCQTKIFENTFSGATLGPLTNSSYVGNALNDRTSSMEFS